jgi:transposase
MRTKGTYLSALYQRLTVRRRKQWALIAVAHSIMSSVVYMLSRNQPYRDLEVNYFSVRRHDTVDRLSRRIAHLGYRVFLEPLPTSAA